MQSKRKQLSHREDVDGRVQTSLGMIEPTGPHMFHCRLESTNQSCMADFNPIRWVEPSPFRFKLLIFMVPKKVYPENMLRWVFNAQFGFGSRQPKIRHTRVR